MKRRNEKKHVIDFLFPLAVFFVLAASSVAIVVLASGFYSRQVKTSSASYSGRTALAYVTEKMHQNDENGAIADGTFDGENVSGATVVGAKAANALLNIQGIRGSFVLTALQDCIYVSARSIDELNVQVIMEKFGGGGHLTMAAAQLKDVSLSDAAEMLKHTLRKMHEDGDI